MIRNMQLVNDDGYDAEVLCDICLSDYTGLPDSGGFIFNSQAICPSCTGLALEAIRSERVEHLIGPNCQPGQAFYHFILEWRRYQFVRVFSAKRG